MGRRKVIRAERASDEKGPLSARIWPVIVAISAVFVVMIFKVGGCQYEQEKRSYERQQEQRQYGPSPEEKPRYSPKDLEEFYRKGSSR